MEIKVLGSGCKKCKTLHDLTVEVVKELGRDDEIEYVTDLQKIIAAGVLSTPALMIDGEVRVAGRVPERKELVRLIVGA